MVDIKKYQPYLVFGACFTTFLTFILVIEYLHRCNLGSEELKGSLTDAQGIVNGLNTAVHNLKASQTRSQGMINRLLDKGSQLQATQTSSQEVISHLNAKVLRLQENLEVVQETMIRLASSFNNSRAGGMVLTRSCKDVARLLNVRTNGTYELQLDYQPAFNVSCYFNGNEAITVVDHDSEAEARIPKCINPKCHQQKITYNASIGQIRALIQHVGNCRQFIKYKCYGSIIFEGHYNQNYAGWETWNGQIRHYWGGSGGRTGYCACGVTGTCSDPTKKCNCDANDAVWRQDSGYLSQAIDLPVTKLFFGDTDSRNEDGKHTLGPLTCQETIY